MAAHAGMPLTPANAKPTALNAIQPMMRVARKPPSPWFIGFILAFVPVAPAAGTTPSR